MTDQESKSLGRYVVLGLLGLIILVAASIATSVIFYVSRSPAAFYPFFPFFPFHFGFLGIILLLFIIFWVARWWFWSWNGGRRAYREHRDPADEILRERYAKGEITKEQFEQMMQDLKRHD